MLEASGVILLLLVAVVTIVALIFSTVTTASHEQEIKDLSDRIHRLENRTYRITIED